MSTRARPLYQAAPSRAAAVAAIVAAVVASAAETEDDQLPRKESSLANAAEPSREEPSDE